MLELPLSLLKSLPGLALTTNGLSVPSGQWLALDGSAVGTTPVRGIRFDPGGAGFITFRVTGSGTALLINDGNANATFNGSITAGAANNVTPTLTGGATFATVSATGGPLKFSTSVGGAAATAGVSAAMTAGSVTVSTTAVTANSIIIPVRATAGGTVGSLGAAPASIVAGTSFVINSSSATETSTCFWWIIN